MIRTHQHPGDVGHDEAHKADGAGNGDTDPRQDGHGDQDDQFDASDIHADMPGVFLADGEGIQFRTETHQDAAAEDQRPAEQQGLVIVYAGEGTHGPETERPGVIVGKGDDQRNNAGNEHGEDDADQDNAGGGQPAK